jgi:hypothetical protein
MKNLLVLLIALSPLVAAEQKIYRTEDQAGQVRFSDRLPVIDPDAVEKVEPEEVLIDHDAMNTTPSSLYTKAIKENEREQKNKAEEKIVQENTLDEKIVSAENVLELAEQALETGQIRSANDIIGKVGGGTRSAPAYIDRVEKLTAKRDAAQAEVDELRREKSKL